MTCQAALTAELQSLKPSALLERARTLGADVDEIDDAFNADDGKLALITLIVAKLQNGTQGERELLQRDINIIEDNMEVEAPTAWLKDLTSHLKVDCVDQKVPEKKGDFQYFDFDALDALLDEENNEHNPQDDVEHKTLESTSSPPVPVVTMEHSCCNHGNDQDTDSDDGLSEVWPGEERMDIEEFETPYEEDPYEAWEVVFEPRIVVRSKPQVDANMITFGSTKELFFVDPRGSSEDWVKLSAEPGYILKDGSQKDPNLGMLIRRFELGSNIPEPLHRLVFDILRSIWVQARKDQTFLKPPEVIRLRKQYEDAVAKATASHPTSFCLETFKASVQPLPGEPGEKAQSVLSTSLSPVAPPAQAGSSGTSGKHPWSYSASCLTHSHTNEVTPRYVETLLKNMKARRLPSASDVEKIVQKAIDIFVDQETLVELQVPVTATLHVVGDLHGQFFDLCHIVDVFDAPSKDNWYLFNGDFVDRGQFSIEVVLALFAMKVAFPASVHLNRGNHESIRMNMLYGFMQEAKLKYSGDIFALLMEAFRSLPLATLVSDSVLVVHGGLPRQDLVKLQDIANLDRKREPDESAPELMIDLLWSDPMERDGRDRSPRGAGMLFGPDVSEQFCHHNGLTCVIRSHEMKFEGYEWHHNQRCLTIFSAANYCGICGNFGAVCNISPRKDTPAVLHSDMSVHRFESSPHPDERNGFTLLP